MSTRREPPKKIYLQVPDDCDDYEDAAKGEVTWCADSINERDIAYVRADLVVLVDEGEPVAWRPIETAPKHGTDVLLSGWNFLRTDRWISTARWKAGAWRDDSPHAYDARRITHWMPLPEPPRTPDSEVTSYRREP